MSAVISVKFIARRWLQLEFESHRHAALARRLLVPGNIAIFRRVEIIRWTPNWTPFVT